MLKRQESANSKAWCLSDSGVINTLSTGSLSDPTSPAELPIFSMKDRNMSDALGI